MKLKLVLNYNQTKTAQLPPKPSWTFKSKSTKIPLKEILNWTEEFSWWLET